MLYKEISKMANHKKDYNSILRSKREEEKQRSYLKRNVKITIEDVKKLEELIRKEKENGVEKSIFKSKGNFMYMINKLLYNPHLIPRERLCFNYEFTNESCMGRLRDGRVISVKMKVVNNKKVYYIKINGKLRDKAVGQTKACEKIRDIIGLPEGWDDEQGSARIFT